jgi:spore germination protein Q
MVYCFYFFNILYGKDGFMNGSYFKNNAFPGTGISGNVVPNQQSVASYQEQYGGLVDEQSYIENILRLNRGKKARLHVTVPGSVEWQDRVFDGIIEQAGKDHVIVSNPQTGEWYLVLMIYLDFVTFEEPINYNKQFYS